MSYLEITEDVLKDLTHRMHSHTEVKEIAVVVLTARELEGLLYIVESALAQGKSGSKCQHYRPQRLGPCLGCGEV